MPTVSGIAHVRKVMHSLLSPGLVIVSFCLVAFFLVSLANNRTL